WRARPAVCGRPAAPGWGNPGGCPPRHGCRWSLRDAWSPPRCPRRLPRPRGPRRQPGDHGLDQRLAQAGVLDAFHRLADEGLDQQRLGLLGRDAARLEIEQERLVERAGGGGMAALDVVAKALQLRVAAGL